MEPTTPIISSIHGGGENMNTMAAGNMNHNNKEKEVCHRYCRFYRNKFRDVPYISSEELVKKTSAPNTTTTATNKKTIVLIDVRTEPERRVSMLEGAITKEQFVQQQQQQQVAEDDDDDDDASQIIIITYCTIGYRSGLEARRLRLLYPHLRNQISSLDGIVSYTHALGDTCNTTVAAHDESNNSEDDHHHHDHQGGADENDVLLATTSSSHQASTTTTKNNHTTSSRNILQLIHPETGEPTNQVHTFGGMWGCVDQRHFDATHFSGPELLGRLLQVYGAILSCFCLRLEHYCCYGCFPTTTTTVSKSNAMDGRLLYLQQDDDATTKCQ